MAAAERLEQSQHQPFRVPLENFAEGAHPGVVVQVVGADFEVAPLGEAELGQLVAEVGVRNANLRVDDVLRGQLHFNAEVLQEDLLILVRGEPLLRPGLLADRLLDVLQRRRLPSDLASLEDDLSVFGDLGADVLVHVAFALVGLRVVVGLNGVLEDDGLVFSLEGVLREAHVILPLQEPFCRLKPHLGSDFLRAAGDLDVLDGRSRSRAPVGGLEGGQLVGLVQPWELLFLNYLRQVIKRPIAVQGIITSLLLIIHLKITNDFENKLF